MKTYTYNRGSLKKGLAMNSDEKLGPILFLGEAGRGRTFQKISLSRRDPAVVTNNLVENAHPVKITIKGTERSFFVLAKPRENPEEKRILVRVNTEWVYTRNTAGYFETLTGTPETIVSGHGARGDAGRVGGWVDSLVILKPGDAISIKPEGGHKTERQVLWYGESGIELSSPENYEKINAEQSAERIIEEEV